ncbi:MAG: primase-helicase family protein [Planctomycetota bacterium]
MSLEFKVGVIHRKEFRSFGRGGSLMESLPLNEALDTTFRTPSLFCCYYVLGEEEWPRLAKADLKDVIAKGGVVKVSCLVFDYDLPKVDGKKVPWECQEEIDDFLTTLHDAQGLWPSALYTTKHGARLIYKLETPLFPEAAERAYRVMLARLAEAGIHSDENTADWTRFFRLPFVRKEDGDDLSENPLIFCETYPHRVLSVEGLIATPTQFTPCVIDSDKPTPEEVDRQLFTLVQSPNGHTRRATANRRRAKRLFGDSPEAAYLFDGAPADFPPGERDTSINRLAFKVCKRIYGRIEDVGPEFAYALLHESISQLPGDTDHPDWTDVLWEKVCRIWEKCEDEHSLKQASIEQLETRMLEGFRAQVAMDGSSLATLSSRLGWSEVDYMRRHLVVCVGKDHYILGPNGDFLRDPVGVNGLHGNVDALGLSEIYGLIGNDGEPVSADVLRRKRAVSATPVGRLGAKVPKLAGFGDGLRLELPSYYLRDDVEPLFVAEVDQWLRRLGGENYERLIDWIGHAQDIYRPICALSLEGAAATGKTFLGELLAARFGPGGKNTEDVFGTWTGGVFRNPVIHCDEGAASFREGKAIDQLFRQFVTGGELTIREKYRMSFAAEVYPRLVITANDLEALRDTVAKRDLDDESHNALAQRVLHIKVPSQGRKWSRESTSNWLVGDKLALRHFAWLFQNRSIPSKWSGAGRLLVEGEVDSPELKRFRFRTPMMEAVQETLIQALGSKGNLSQVVQAFEDDPRYILVRTDALRQAMVDLPGHHQKLSLTSTAIGTALGKLSKGRLKHPRRFIIPMETLLDFAQEVGMDCDRLQRLCEAAELGERFRN